MSVRTMETAITFRRPFRLNPVDDRQPAGTYRLEIDEEEILGLTFVAYRRIATMLHTPAISVASGRCQVFEIDSAELAAALEADALI